MTNIRKTRVKQRMRVVDGIVADSQPHVAFQDDFSNIYNVIYIKILVYSYMGHCFWSLKIAILESVAIASYVDLFSLNM